MVSELTKSAHNRMMLEPEPIEETLRQMANDSPYDYQTLVNAANELTRLRSENEKLRKAVEFAGYLAHSAEGFMQACNNCSTEDAIEPDEAYSDYWEGLKVAIYEFEKRKPVKDEL